jgi:hypothetical protein
MDSRAGASLNLLAMAAHGSSFPAFVEDFLGLSPMYAQAIQLPHWCHAPATLSNRVSDQHSAAAIRIPQYFPCTGENRLGAM